MSFPQQWVGKRKFTPAVEVHILGVFFYNESSKINTEKDIYNLKLSCLKICDTFTNPQEVALQFFDAHIFHQQNVKSPEGGRTEEEGRKGKIMMNTFRKIISSFFACPLNKLCNIEKYFKMGDSYDNIAHLVMTRFSVSQAP